MGHKSFILFSIIIIVVAGIIYLERQKPPRLPESGSGEIEISMDNSKKADKYSAAREITAPADFINTDEITIKELISKKVILIDFWTYSCINCQRTLPYLTEWYDKYRDEGLEIIGVHTPEFEFEKKKENVEWAVNKYGIEYPIVLDNDYGTWRAYGNRYWPRKYIIDIDGYVVYGHIGEGAYDETEEKIQELLKERSEKLGEDVEISKGVVDPQGAEIPLAFSPETYFGSLRNTYLGNGQTGVSGVQNFEEPQGIKNNILYLSGEWDIQGEYASNIDAGAKIIYEYRAQKVFLVMSADKEVKIEVLVDEKPLSQENAGDDIFFENSRSYVGVSQERLYRLVEDLLELKDHTLELIIQEPGVKAYAFTFG